MREKIHTGSKGGKYVVRFGKKVYLSSFGVTEEQSGPRIAPAPTPGASGMNRPLSGAHDDLKVCETALALSQRFMNDSLQQATIRQDNLEQELRVCRTNLANSKNLDRVSTQKASGFGADTNIQSSGRNKPKKPAHDSNEELKICNRKKAECQVALARMTTDLENITDELDEAIKKLMAANNTIFRLRNKQQS